MSRNELIAKKNLTIRKGFWVLSLLMLQLSCSMSAEVKNLNAQPVPDAEDLPGAPVFVKAEGILIDQAYWIRAQDHANSYAFALKSQDLGEMQNQTPGYQFSSVINLVP